MAGFEILRDTLLAGDRGPLEEFHAAAGALVRDRAAAWGRLVRERPLAQAERSLALTEAVARGDIAHLGEARVQEAVPSAGERGFGMCGRLRTYDVTDTEESQ